MTVNLKALIGKLNHQTRSAVEGSAGLCLARTHYDVEVEHLIAKMLDATDGDLAAALRHYGVDRSRLEGDLGKALDRLKTGNARTPALSPHLVRLLTEAWTLGSLDYGATQVRTGHVLLALLADPDLARLANEISREFGKISVEALRKELPQVTAETAEEAAAQRAGASAGGAPSGNGMPRPGGKTPNLDQ